ncbi:hypothetical protein ACQPYE_24385 [Actinosynnema sp. CA-299493]
MKGLRALLTDAVPELPEVDRLAEVGRRVRRRRRVRGAVASGAVVAVTAGALVGAQWFGSVREEHPVATPPLPVVSTPVLECPAEAVGRPGSVGPAGPVADESAVNALLCAYTGPTHLDFRAEIGHDVAAVVRAMNELSPEYPVEEGGGVLRACSLLIRPQYRIVLGYPDGKQHVVGFDMSCGRLYRDDLVRYGDLTRPLAEFAAIVRADGREFPYPHGEW